MFELRKSFNFEASHVLERHDGKCSRLHGHSYVLTVIIEHRSLQRFGPKKNMVADFSDVSAAVKPLIASHLDHHNLNDTLKTDSPTAEYIALWIYRALAPKIAWLEAIELRETASSVVTYRPSQRTKERAARRYHDWDGRENEMEWDSSEEDYCSDVSGTGPDMNGMSRGVSTGSQNGHATCNGSTNGRPNGAANGKRDVSTGPANGDEACTRSSQSATIPG